MRPVLQILAVLLVVAVALLAIGLVALNPEPVRIQLGVFDLPQVAVGVLAASALGIGLGLGLVTTVTSVVRHSSRDRALRRRVSALEHEVHDLRTLPLKEQ